MFRVLGMNRSLPPREPTDVIVPLGDFDDNWLYRYSAVVSCMFVVDDVLDVNILRSTLEALVEKPGWRKLGSRLRFNVKRPGPLKGFANSFDQALGRLECHIPAEFTPDRPAIRYSLVVHLVKKATHPIASRLPERTGKPAVMIDSTELPSLMHPPDGPTKLDHFLDTNEPLLGLRIVKFTDATMITISWPHILFDIMGLADLLNAWTLMLQGRGGDIRTPHGVDNDPLAKLGLCSGELYDLRGRRMSWPSVIVYALRTWLRFRLSKKQHRMVHVPGWYLKLLREAALQELSADGIDQDTTFLSEGDILCAWWARLSVSHLEMDSERSVALENALSLRSVLSSDLLPFGQPFLANSTGFIVALMTVRDIASKPLSEVAYRVRQSIIDLGKREQVEAFAALWRRSWKRILPLFGDHTTHLVTFTNWSKAKLFDVDFSPAVVHQGPTIRRSFYNPGQPSYIQSHIFGVEFFEYVVIVGKDADGGYWMDCSTNEARWANIEDIIAKEMRG